MTHPYYTSFRWFFLSRKGCVKKKVPSINSSVKPFFKFKKKFIRKKQEFATRASKFVEILSHYCFYFLDLILVDMLLYDVEPAAPFMEPFY